MGKVCNNCGEKNGAASAQKDKKIIRLKIALFAATVSFVATNAIWIYAWCQHLL